MGSVLYEAKVLQSLQGGLGIPSLLWYGKEGDYNLFVTSCIGDNLQDLHIFCKFKFTLKTTLMLVD